MSKKVSMDDVSVTLYLVPFIASAAFALYLGIVDKVSKVLSPTVYLTVTRDPILFLTGTFCVFLGVVVEVSSTNPSGRIAKLGSVSNTLQTIAAASFILAILCVIYANGFGDLSGAANDFILGRYSFIFPITMVISSYLITARFNMSAVGTPAVLGIVAMLLVPVALYEAGKRSTLVGLLLALVVMIGGLGLFVLSARKTSTQGSEGDANQ